MKKISIFLINLYQITPLHSHTMCRFVPTCSEYAKIKINEFGFIKGCYLGIKRILKCHPFGKSGYDL
ncbi:MAG: membrane protein insertion efficiency factor YidD [Bacilli bacterium]|nr:membrane protein insertion efficiency factor YidD [Bacilli bacterium]